MAKRENIIRAYERAVEQLFSNKAAFADYLDFSGRFYKLPSSQTIMIYDDNPNAKMVADYDTWQQFGRRVKPGGWSTDVLDNGKIRRLFDISMTRGEKTPYQWSLNKKTAEEFTERLSKSENRNFTGMSDCIYHLAANAVSERFEDVANLLDIPEKDEELFRRSFSSMVRRVIAARCEWNSDFTYGGTGAAKGVDLSALDFLDNSGDMETLLEEVQITAKNVLKSMEKSINDIILIFERSIDNERNERVDRARGNDIGRGGTSSVVRGGEDIYAVDNDAQREDVQARREDVPVHPDDGIIADERGTGADEHPDKPLGESVADVYDGELPVGYTEVAGQTSVGFDSAQDRQGSVGDHGENTGGISVDEPASNVGERVGLGGTAESSDRGTDNGVFGERSENGAVTSQSNENTLTAENNSAVNYLSLRIADLSDAFVQKYDGDYKDFTLANYAFSHTGAEYDLNLSVRENAEKMLRNGQYNYLKNYLDAIFKEAFEDRIIVDEGTTAGEIISQLSKLRAPKPEKMPAHSEDGEQLRLFPEPLDKKQQAELEKLTAELTDEFASWEKQFIDGGSDAFYEDGVGLDLIRNHILHYKYELEEKFPNNLPEIYHRETPPEYPRTYQSVKKGDTLRFEYGDYLVLSIEKTNEYSGEYTVQLQDKNGEVITQNLREIKTKFQNLTNRGEVPSRAENIQNEADITNIPSDLDKFYVNKENERVTRVYYNPDSDAGGQLVYEHFTFDQIFDAMIKEDALEYLTEVCRQELVDVTAPDFFAKSREFLADTEDFNSRDEGYLDKLGALAEPTFSIMQLKDGENLRDYRFEGMAELRERGLYIDRENYRRVYRGRLTDGETLEDIYTRFNVDRPKDFYGHSLSVGDIIGIVRDGKPAAYYVDSAGFEEVPDFLLDLEERRARRTLTDNIGLYAENMLASDEMDDLGDYLFDPNCTYDRGDLTIGDANFPFDELRKLAERYKNGEDIRAELGRGIYAPRGEISYYGKYGYDFPNPKITVTRDENGMNFKTKGGFEITYSWEQLGEAMITAARNEYERHETLDRVAEITDIIEEVRNGKTAAITEKTEEQIAMVADARKKTFDNITLKFDNDRGFHLTADTANEHGAVITIFGANVQAVGEYLERNAEQIELTAPVIDRAEKKMKTEEFMADFVPYNEKKVITAEKVGDFYEFYGDIAVELSEKFNLTLTQRNGKPMVGVPAYNFEDFCDEIFDKGYMVENDPAYQEIVKPHVTVIPSRARAEELIEEYYDREFGEFDREDYNFRNPSRVGLAYTDDEETGLPKEVYADLDGCRIVTTFNNVVVNEEKFKSLDEMNVALDNLSFDDLVFLTEEQRIIGIKKTFDGLKVGDTVRGDGEIWTITKITGDFSINYKNIDPAAQTTEQSVYGGWKELFAKRGFVRVSSEELEQTVTAPENVIVTTQVAIESTDDFSDSDFHAETDVKTGEVKEYYRLVTVGENGLLKAYDDAVYDSRDDARTAISKDAGLIEIAYDNIVNKAVEKRRERDINSAEKSQEFPTITCELSENSAFEDGKTYTIAEFDRLMKRADDEHVAGEKAAIEKYGSRKAWSDAVLKDEDKEFHSFLGYDKVKFTLNMPDGTKYTERQDIGDGYGGVIDFLSQYPKYREIIPILEQARVATETNSFRRLKARYSNIKGQLDELKNEVTVTKSEIPKFTVEQTSDAFEEPFIIRNNDVSEDSPDRYYDIDGTYQTFETESEAQEYADKLNSTAESALEKVSPVTQSSGDIISDFREKTDEYYNKLGGYSAQAIEDIIKYFIRGAIRENELSAEVGEVVLYGSRCRGMENENSDLDFVAEMYSDLKEDALFNILHETPFEIGGVSVDINPIRAEESGTLEDYLLRAEQYLQQKGTKENKVSEVQDYRVEEIEQTSFGQKSRYAANVAAIRALNQIESENRTATPDEQKILAQYVGWGGIPTVFDSDNAAWAAEYAELKELLTPDEYEAARSTVLTAHYTSPTVISAIYSALDKFGFKGGNILEPSMGIGNFFGVMPEEMRSQSSLHGVELDDISGRIAKQLYPNADIQICGYENTAFSDNFFNAAVGNVPFGNYPVADTRYDREHFLIHDYFFAKTLDKVAPGGVVAFITSKGTLDKESPKVREYLAKRADLIGAIRLPNNAFKANAGTEVTADIIFLQKREKMSVEKPDWCYTAEIAEGISVNQYFVDHPEMILGEMKLVSGRYGYETACVPIEGADLKEQLNGAVMRLRRDIITARREDKRNEEHGIIPATADVRNFTFTEVNDKIYFRENNIMREIPFSKRNHERMRGMIGIRNTFRALVDAQSKGCSDETLSGLQFRLNAEYDAFVINWGHISDIDNRKLFAVDDDYNTLCGALELIDPETKTVTKADIFTKRTIKPYVEVTHVDTPQEALFVSLDMRGAVDIDYMSELCGTPNEEVIRELTEDGFIYKNPETEKYEEAAEYLSGYVREKLRQAQDAAADDPEYERNVAALEKVLPAKLEAGDISVRLGVPWITIDDYCKFFREFAKGSIYSESLFARETVLLRSISGEYKIHNKGADKSIASQSSFGTKRMNSYYIFENLLNNRDIVVYDAMILPSGGSKRVLNKIETQLAQEKARQMKEAFPKWLWSDPERREKYVEIYNELFNSLVGREYDGSHQTFPGMNPFIELNEHQKNAVMRAKIGGNTLLAHCVGAGKTFEMAAAVMEKRRIGLINKACIVVPKHLVGQMSAEWLRLYPEARLLTAKENDFNDVNRQKFIGRCCTGDYDAIIMSYQQFQKIPMSFEYQQEFLTKQLSNLTEQLHDFNGYLTANDKRSVKDLERMKKNIEAKLKRLLDMSHDNSLNFEQLGFDCIVVDEAHNYKNGLVVTKMRNVSGIGSRAAKKSEDFLMKTWYLNEKFGERNLILASGTPVSNSMTELYIMQQYLRPSALLRQGLQNFDDWASTFGEVVSQLELKPAGDGFRMKKRFAKFTNLPELMQAYKDFADIRTVEMLNLPVPEIEGGKPQVISAKPNEFQQAYMKVLAERSEAIHNGSVDPSVDNMLKITNEARLLGLDARTINPDADNYPNSKVNLLIEKVMEIYTETTAQKGVQAIFCDIAINDGKKDTNEIEVEIDDGESEKTLSAEEQAELLGASKFSVYKYVKEELIRRGIPESEICFAGDAKDQGQRGEMYAQLRAGTKRIVLASTTKMGTGANIQTRLCALHNLDIPWKPSDFEQRIGRIVRQGNNFPTVKIFNYVTEGTFDAYMLNLIVTKQKFISQLMSGKTPARTCEDVDELVLNYSEMQAIASGDPRIKEKIQLDTDVSRLRLLENEHLNKKYQLEDKVTFCQAQISIAKKQLTLAQDDKEFAAKNTLPEGEFKITLNGKIFTERKEAGAELRKAQMDFLSKKQATEIGEYRGFKMSLNWGLVSMNQYAVSVELTKRDKGLRYSTELELQNDLGNITRLENILKLGIDKRISGLQAELARNEKDLAEALRTKDAPFEYADELAQKSLRLAQLDAELGVGKKDEVIIDDENQDEDRGKGRGNNSPDQNKKPKRPKR